MIARPFASIVAMLLTVAFVVPSAFLISTPRVHAVTVAVVSDTSATSITTSIKTTITAIQSTLTAVHTYTSMIAEYAMWVKAYILDPLAFVLSGKLIKALTAGVLAFVIGKANGTGIPQFIVDVRKSIQTVQDGYALAYLKQIGNTNSPFSSSISAALGRDYSFKSSLKGFWEANLCTLSRSSPSYTPAYLSGRWSDGGLAAWFALTTQVQNNPYTLYQNTQAQLASGIGAGAGGVSGARLSELGWGQGFMSWCGQSADTGTSCSDANGNPGTISSGGVCLSAGATAGSGTTCSDANGNMGTLNSAGQCVADSSSVVAGVNPGDPCVNSDGTAGVIKTPGSTIKATLDKVLGAQQDQVVRMGDVGGQINQILKDVATVMQTVQFAQKILGGNDAASSGGLLGVDSGGTSSRLYQYQNSPGSLGLTGSQIYQNVSSTQFANGSDMTTRITNYLTAWNTIKAAATNASQSVQSLETTCKSAADSAALTIWNSQYNNPDGLFFSNKTPNQADLDAIHSSFIDAARAQAVAAHAAITAKIAPVLYQVSTAEATADAATAFVQKVQSELGSVSNTDAGVAAAGTTYDADVQKLKTMSPTDTDVVQAQFNAEANGTAEAIPPGSLNVSSDSGASLVDQMNLLGRNAEALKSTVCTDYSNANAFGG